MRAAVGRARTRSGARAATAGGPIELKTTSNNSKFEQLIHFKSDIVFTQKMRNIASKYGTHERLQN